MFIYVHELHILKFLKGKTRNNECFDFLTHFEPIDLKKILMIF